MEKNSGENKESSVNFEKSLEDWKLRPLFSASDIFEKKSSFCLFPDFTVKTVEKEIPLTQRRSRFPLFSKYRRKAHQIFHGYVQVGMIMVGVKPSKLGSNASAVICIRDKRLSKYNTVLAMGESSLCDGPIFFSYFPTYCVPLSDSSVAFGIDVRVKGNERVSLNLMYKFHYKVRKMPTAVKWEDNHDGIIDVERGKTTLYLDNINIAQGEGEGEGEGEGGSSSNRLVSKTINWYHIAIREGLMMPENDVSLPTYGSDSEVGDTKIDWKETAEAHALKLDVPGFEREEVKVEVENGSNILQISGEKWHREERSSTGKILRRFRLPENAKLEEEVKAAMGNGVLTVTILKEEVKKPQVKLVHISA